MSPIGPGIRLAAGVLLTAASVVLAIIAAQSDEHLVRHRAHTCDPHLSMPTGAFVAGWGALTCASVGLLLMIVATGQSPLVRVLAGVGTTLVLLGYVFVLHTLYGDAAVPSPRQVCPAYLF